MENRDPKPDDTYITKLNAMLPAEVTGLYLFLHSLANPDTDLYLTLFAFAFVISVVIYLIAPQLLSIDDRLTRVLYSITFLLWVCAIEVAALRLYITWKPFSFVVAGCTAIWTFALPYVFTAIKLRQRPT